MMDRQFSFEGFQAAKALLSHYRGKPPALIPEPTRNFGAAMESVRSQPGFAEVAGMLASAVNVGKTAHHAGVEPLSAGTVMTAAIYNIMTKVAQTEIAARTFVERYAQPGDTTPPLDRLQATLDTAPGARENLAAVVGVALHPRAGDEGSVGQRTQGVLDKLGIMANLRPA